MSLSLEQDILENGIRQPLLITEDGLILNGWRRYRIAKKLGLKSVPVVVFHGEVEEMDVDMLVPPYGDQKEPTRCK